MDQIMVQTIVQCQKEGLSAAQRDCLLAIPRRTFPAYDKFHKDAAQRMFEVSTADLRAAGRCPAITASPPTWLRLPPAMPVPTYATNDPVVPEDAGLSGPTVTYSFNRNGPLSNEVVRTSFDQVAPTLVECYRRALAKDPTLGGVVSVSLFVVASGSVQAIDAEGVDPQLAACVAGVARRIVFPRAPSSGGGTQVSAQLRFGKPSH